MDGYERSPVEDLVETGDEVEDEIRFFVAGEPQPKGSTRSFYVKKIERVVTTTTNKNTKQWQLRIATEAQRANESRAVSFFKQDKGSGYEVEALFLFSRPKSLPKKVRSNTKRPDLDKLIRALLDGLANILLPDDSQVTSIKAGKRYIESGETPGAEIRVRRSRK
ncbi:MAG TPA: RusA family crossover junction endodeoxyribonuclease [Methanomassiliicoccales archaeon]|nr:RusA family crossover junction endodeoxyribonuclease [Methanomassiliicoccales archaeon]